MRRILYCIILLAICISTFAADRTVTLPGIWASDANSTIPETPIKGTTYRNTSFDSDDIAAGWPYDTVVYSEYFNQFLYLETSLLKQLEEQGILSWNSETDYITGSLCFGSNMQLYVALQDSTNKNPISEATYWELFRSPASTSTSGIVQLSNLYSGTSQTKATTEKALTDGLATKVSNTGNETVAGVKTFSSFPVSPSSAPTTNYQVANKKYVDDNVGRANYDPTSMTGATDSIGEITFPNGFIMKWGSKAVSGSSSTEVVFEDEGLTDFPNACFQVITCGGKNAGHTELGVNAANISTTGFTAYYYGDGGGRISPFRWIAVGY